MTLREVFRATHAGQLFRFVHFPKPPAEWTLDMELLIEELDPNEPDNAGSPHRVADGYRSSVFSSDIAHIVHHADQLLGRADDQERLSALRYYYHHRLRVFEDWQPGKE